MLGARRVQSETSMSSSISPAHVRIDYSADHAVGRAMAGGGITGQALSLRDRSNYGREWHAKRWETDGQRVAAFGILPLTADFGEAEIRFRRSPGVDRHGVGRSESALAAAVSQKAVSRLNNCAIPI